MRIRPWCWFPIAAFVLVLAVFAQTLISGRDPRTPASPLIGKQLPDFTAPVLGAKTQRLKSVDLLSDDIVLVNFFASWCASCKAEQGQLSQIQKATGVKIYGIAYKDSDQAALAWLKKNGNPFTRAALDADGRIAIDFGVTGVPETFVIGKDGRVLYRHAGPIDASAAENIFIPFVTKEKP